MNVNGSQKMKNLPVSISATRPTNRVAVSISFRLAPKGPNLFGQKKCEVSVEKKSN